MQTLPAEWAQGFGGSGKSHATLDRNFLVGTVPAGYAGAPACRAVLPASQQATLPTA